VWGGVVNAFEVVRARERKNECGRRFSPPNANTERNTLDISGGPMKLA
jgi:hypothetical protein